MSVRNRRLALAGVTTARFHPFRCRLRRASPPTARTAAAILAATALTLLAACSGGNSGSPGVASAGSSSAGGSSSPSSSASADPVAFSQCMRSHGVPNFPDPDSSGQIAKKSPQQLGVSNSQYQAAQQSCQHLLPNNGGQPQSEQQVVTDMWKFGRCMRSHGVPNWPDPTIDPDGRPNFRLHGKIDPDSPQIKAKIDACNRATPVLGHGGGIIP